MPLPDIKQLQSEFKRALLDQAYGGTITELGISKLQTTALQLISYIHSNPYENILPTETIDQLNNIEKQLLNNKIEFQKLTSINFEVLKNYGINELIERLKSKSTIQDELYKIISDPNYGDDELYEIDDLGDVLSRKQIIVFQWLEHLRNHPRDSLNQDILDDPSLGFNDMLQELIEDQEIKAELRRLQEEETQFIEENKILNIDKLAECELKRDILKILSSELNDKAITSMLAHSAIDKEDVRKLQIIELVTSYEHEINDDDITKLIDKTSESLKKNMSFLKKVRSMRTHELRVLGIENATQHILEENESYILELQKELRKIIISEEYGNQTDKYGLTKKELTVLRLINAIDPKIDQHGQVAESLSKQEKDFLNNFVEQSMGNMELNQKLRKITNSIGEVQPGKRGEKIKHDPKLKDEIQNSERFDLLSSIRKMEKFTYKTRRVKEYDSIATKFIRNTLGKSKNKLSLREYGILADIDKISTEPPLPKSIYKDSSKLSILYNRAARVGPQLNQIKEDFQKHLSSNVMFVMENRKKLNAIQGNKMTFWQKLKYLVNNRMHAAMIYRKKDEKSFTESHVNGDSGVSSDEFSFGDFMYSDLYKLKLSSLISKDISEKLREHYLKDGKNWEEEITKKFTDIQRTIHDQKDRRLNRIKLANYEKRGGKSMFEHFQFKKTDFKKIRDRMMGNFYKSNQQDEKKVEMICSEFVA